MFGSAWFHTILPGYTSTLQIADVFESAWVGLGSRGMWGVRVRLGSVCVRLRDKEVNMAARDSNDALVCYVENTVEDRIMDSGASFHATYCKEELQRFKLCSSYNIGFRDQQWKVTKGSLVVAHGNKCGSLYMDEDRYEHVSFQKLRSRCTKGLSIPEEEWQGKDTSLTHLKAAAQMKYDIAFGIRRVTSVETRRGLNSYRENVCSSLALDRRRKKKRLDHLKED
uniref:Retrovirus-related Pol polyprotein from transposon TNT 1-94 n=1 Tax=Tanacetum cinerariifolium TaxID=118510 RepID=A0A6L2LF60_TANCI|nr:hypothetical protein [Tanacetum cinerariifolium]